MSVLGVKNKRKKQDDNSTTLLDSAENIDSLKLNVSRPLDADEKSLLAKELFIRDKLTKSDVLKLLFNNPQNLNLNFKNIDGNRTGSALYQAFSKILEISGHESINFKKSADEIVEQVKTIFSALGWNTEVLCFDSEKELDKQPYFKLWHLLYSFEGDSTPTGDGNLIQKIADLCGFEKDYASILANITFQ